MYNKSVLSENLCNDSIYKKLKNEEIFLASRLGGVESGIISRFIDKTPYPDEIKYMACNNAGINPTDDRNLDNFSINYINSIRDIDILGYWDTGVDNILNTFAPNAELYELPGLEPYYSFENPWSKLLKDKKVLVVHPFDESIKSQYQKREKLFIDTEILPNFELITVKAEQTMGNFNSNYFDSLNIMKEKIDNLQFDIALIGCGSYGLPLGSFVKSYKKKSVVHLGGCLQILFGIMGNRWHSNQRIMKFFNENWVRPSESERTKNFNLVEGGCYW